MRIRLTYLKEGGEQPGMTHIDRVIPDEFKAAFESAFELNARWLSIKNQKGEIERINIKLALYITELKD